MKKIFAKVLLLLTALFIVISCKKMDSKYKEFIVPGGRVYTEKVKSPRVYNGFNRIKVEWLRGIDPNVERVKIFYNNYADSVTVNIPAGADTISHTFENLEEKTYSFFIKTYDGKGNSSVPVEVFGTSYGENYRAGLLNRFMSSAEADALGNVSIAWGLADLANGVVASEIRYVDLEGNTKSKRFDKGEAASVLPGYKAGTELEYRTLYLPDTTAIDTFFTAFEHKKVSAKINKSNWTGTVNSWERFAQQPSGPVDKAFDDNINTYWHSNHTELITGYPYWLAADMKAPVTVTRIEMFSRLAYFDQDFTDFTVQGSMDGLQWTNYGSFKMAGVAQWQSFIIDGAPQMRHIRIYMTKGITVHAYLSELTVYGY